MRLPKPSPGFDKQVRESKTVTQTLVYTNSGNLTSSVSGALLGPVVFVSGEIKDVVLSVSNQGRDDAGDELSLVADLKINGSSALSGETQPTVTGASGEAGTAQVSSAQSFSTSKVGKGDRLTLDLNLTRTTPDTEIQDINVGVVVVQTM